jgi:hypothetical protein
VEYGKREGELIARGARSLRACRFREGTLWNIERHSGLMLAARITLAHFSVSSAMSLPKSAGEPANAVAPTSANRAPASWDRQGPQDISNRVIADGSSQNEILFMRGNAMSGAPIISGHHPIAEAADQGRHHHEKDHDEAMRRGEDIVGVRIGKDLQPRLLQFHAHADRQRPPPDNPRRKREDEVNRADVLVVGGIDIAAPSNRMIAGVVRLLRDAGSGASLA